MTKIVVLIVESEALIRIGAIETLEDAGYAVLNAFNSDEAIKILESRNDIRVVFTDIKMSGSIDGLKLAHAIRGRWPPIHLIVTSGRNVSKERELPVRARFILKPYEGGQLVATLENLVSSTS